MLAFLASDRSTLRPFHDTETGVWSGWFNDPDVTRLMNKGLFPNTPDAQVRHRGWMSESTTDLNVAIALKADDVPVGVIGLHGIDWVHRHADISVVIGSRQHQSLGLAGGAIGLLCAHAFRKLNLHKVTAGLWEPNRPCRRAFEKNGFIEEAVIKEQWFFADRYVDEVRLGLTRTEWLTRNST